MNRSYFLGVLSVVPLTLACEESTPDTAATTSAALQTVGSAKPTNSAKPRPAKALKVGACIKGRWKTSEVELAYERLSKVELSNFKGTKPSGSAEYHFDPKAPEGGAYRFIAKDFDNKATFGGSGADMTVAVKLTGELSGGFTLIGEDRIRIQKPSENTLQLDTKVTAAGADIPAQEAEFSIETYNATITCAGDKARILADEGQGLFKGVHLVRLP